MADLRDRIAEALSEFRCQHTLLDDDGGGMPLLDMLTPQGDTSVARGFEELNALADHIADACAQLTVQQWWDGLSASEQSSLRGDGFGAVADYIEAVAHGVLGDGGSRVKA